MPNRNLNYVLKVNAGSAVSTLNQVGRAGVDAASDIATGFDQAGTAAEQAIRAMSATMDQLDTDAQAAARAVAAIGEHLTIDVDSSTITRFTQDIRSKFGVTFDAIEADAKQFADVLERGVNMDKTTSAIRQVGDELDHTRDAGDQSRSVLANLAGNSAQSMGELGGVVGDLGVGIGQLAEYAVDGNIKLSQLASVAGPMAALAAASLLVTEGMKGMSEIKAFDAERAQQFTDAIREGVAPMTSLRDIVAETGELMTVQNGAFGTFGGAVKDILPTLKSLGINYGEFMGLLSDDVQFQALIDLREQTSDPQLRSDMQHVIDAVSDYRVAINEAGADQVALNDFFEVTPGLLNEQNAAYQASKDPINAASGAWEELTKWVKEGGPATDAAASSMEHLTETTGMLPAEILAIIDANLADELAKQTEHADATAAAYKELAEESAAARANVADLARTMGSADFDAVGIEAAGDALADWFASIPLGGGSGVQAVRDYHDAFAAFAAAIKEDGGVSADILGGFLIGRTDESREQVDLLQQLGETVMPRITEAFDDADGSFEDFNRSVTTISDNIHKDLVAALIESGVEAGEAEDQANSLQQRLGLIPENVETMFRLQGDAAARAQLDLLMQDLTGIPPEVISEVRALILADDPQAAIAALQAEVSRQQVTASMGLNTGPAWNDYYSLTNGIEGNTISAPVRLVVQNIGALFGLGNSNKNSRSAPAAAATATPTTTATTTTATPTPMAWPVARPSVTVNITAGVIGGRYDVERAVVGALRDAERLGRI